MIYHGIWYKFESIWHLLDLFFFFFFSLFQVRHNLSEEVLRCSNFLVKCFSPIRWITMYPYIKKKKKKKFSSFSARAATLWILQSGEVDRKKSRPPKSIQGKVKRKKLTDGGSRFTNCIVANQTFFFPSLLPRLVLVYGSEWKGRCLFWLLCLYCNY